MPDHPLKTAVENVVNEQNCDVYLYAGDIDRNTCTDLIDSCPEDPKPNALLILSSFGGDAHAAFRLTRHLKEVYKDHLTLFIPTMCKSAGTLVAIGADNLVMSPHGELGPLDVQVSERDELWERRSGLVPIHALETIRKEAFTFFEESFLSVRGRSHAQITTRTAAEIASELTAGLFEPLIAQIDPLRVADIRLSMRIAEEYGKLLQSQNVKVDTIHKLVYAYPSHDFVLDKQEATRLFNNVRVPTDAESELADGMSFMVTEALHDDEPLALLLSANEFLALLPSEDSPAYEDSHQEPQNDHTQQQEKPHEDSAHSQEN